MQGLYVHTAYKTNAEINTDNQVSDHHCLPGDVKTGWNWNLMENKTDTVWVNANAHT